MLLCKQQQVTLQFVGTVVAVHVHCASMAPASQPGCKVHNCASGLGLAPSPDFFRQAYQACPEWIQQIQSVVVQSGESVPSVIRAGSHGFFKLGIFSSGSLGLPGLCAAT